MQLQPAHPAPGGTCSVCAAARCTLCGAGPGQEACCSCPWRQIGQGPRDGGRRRDCCPGKGSPVTRPQLQSREPGGQTDRHCRLTGEPHEEEPPEQSLVQPPRAEQRPGEAPRVPGIFLKADDGDSSKHGRTRSVHGRGRVSVANSVLATWWSSLRGLPGWAPCTRLPWCVVSTDLSVDGGPPVTAVLPPVA